MPGLANVKFKDLFAVYNGGFAAKSLATGTTSGNVLSLGSGGNIGKMLFRALCSMTTSTSDGAASVSMFLQTATASGASFTSISQTLVSLELTSVSASSLAPFANLQELRIDTRNEAFANLATASAAPLWVQPVVALGGNAIDLFLDVLGWEAGNDPASNFNGSNVTVTETDFY